MDSHHKPLEMILKKFIKMALSRLQCMLLCLQPCVDDVMLTQTPIYKLLAKKYWSQTAEKT